jgi:acetolactate synthase small subunit
MFLSEQTNWSNVKYYFTIDDKKFLSDIDAIKYRNKYGGDINFKFNYSFTENANLWKINPNKSIIEYQDLHCRIIKEKYDNIILMYSGGTDSHTILNALIRNNIRNVTLYEATNSEHKSVSLRLAMVSSTLKQLEKYKYIFQNLNYKVVSSALDRNKELIANTEKELDVVLDKMKPQKFLDIYHSGSFYRAFSNKNNKHLFDMTRKTCVIWGFEKPRIKIHEGYWSWYMKSSDIIYGKIPANDIYDDIFFFVSDDVPEIQIKLAWIKVLELEKIFRNHSGMHLTNENLDLVQNYQSNYYVRLNHAMGYSALNASLNGGLYKPGGWLQKAIHAKVYNIRPEPIKRLIEDYKGGIFKDTDLGFEAVPIPIRKI